MTSRYSRYDTDRRSRSPRARSPPPDRFDRGPQHPDDRRRSLADARSNVSTFPPNRDAFPDNRREPPRGPKALVDAPSGPRGGAFAGDFRGGRGRGRGRGWPARDDSRDRGRDRDIDFRDRYREERSRERERDRDRDRDWRDPREFRSRRSPVARARTPPRDFRDRDGPPLTIDAERPLRDARDAGPPSAGSASSDPPLGLGHFPPRGGFGRGRGRGGRGDWTPDRGRARFPFDDRNDRHPRSRSQEGRWNRDERDRQDRYADPDIRRDPRDDRDRPGDRELFRAKLDARASLTSPVAPAPSGSSSTAPAASAADSATQPTQAAGAPGSASTSGIGGTASKVPPTAPRAFGERPGSSGYSGPADSAAIPLGPRAQQKQQQRPSSKQWINPNLKKPSDSPTLGRAQTFTSQHTSSRPPPIRQENTFTDFRSEERRREARTDANGSGPIRTTREVSAEPGEIIKSEDEDDLPPRSEPYPQQSHAHPKAAVAPPSTTGKHDSRVEAKALPSRVKRNPLNVGVVRFSLPPKTSAADAGSESDDDDDMADYFDMQIEKAEAELGKLQAPKLPIDVVARFAAMSHGSMVKILTDTERFSEMLGPLPEGFAIPITETPKLSSPSLARLGDVAANSNNQDQSEGSRKARSTVSPKLHVKADPVEPGPKAETTEASKSPNQLSAIITEESTQPRGVGLGIQESMADLTPAARAAEDEVMKDGETNTPHDVNEPLSKPSSTPSQIEDEGDDETESEDEAFLNVDQVRPYMTTPPLESLPDYAVDAPWDKDQDLLQALNPDGAIVDFVAHHLAELNLKRKAEQNQERRDYADKYLRYLDFTKSSDPTAIKSRGKFATAAPPPEPISVVVPEPPKPEGRGTGRRFASERDLERVIQASMREDEERRERELRAQKEKYRSDKEATIPDMYWTEAEKEDVRYVDRSGFVSQDRLVSLWHILPPINNFTEEEVGLFEKRYLELPKQWGKVAEAIPKRDFGTCIQYYYMMKKELNLKEKLKKQPKRRKKGGRGKQRSSALVSELGNVEADAEDNTETGENGERRRPRRAAAPTWGFEQTPTENDAATATTGTTTPSRRGAGTAKGGEQSEKPDGRKGRRKAAKDKESKTAKPAQTLAAAPANGAKSSRSRSSSRAPNADFQNTTPADLHRISVPLDRPLASGMQPPFSVHQQAPSLLDRPPPLTSSLMSEVLAPPSLRPEPPPPPQPAMSTFNLAQPSQERKAPTQASSYWSVSETNDFPQLLRAFGTDWNAIAAHMGSKTAVMVKNYFVRQKDQGKTEWEAIALESDAKRAKGERRPDPPQPSTGGRGRRYDTAGATAGRPLAVAGGPEVQAETSAKADQDSLARQAQQPLGSYGVPIAQALPQQPIAQPGQKPLLAQRSNAQPVSLAMSPPSRTRLQPFGFPDGERDVGATSRERPPLSGAPAKTQDPQDPRPLVTPGGGPQMIRGVRAEGDRSSMAPTAQRERERERERHQHQHQDWTQSADQRNMFDAQARMNKFRADFESRAKQEHEMATQRGYEPFSSRGGPPPPPVSGLPANNEPLSLSRAPGDATRMGSVPGQPYSSPGPSVLDHSPRSSMLGDPSSAQPPPGSSGLSARPMSAAPSRQDPYGVGPPSQSSTPAPPSSILRPPEPRKTSSIMSLLNDDEPTPPRRRVNDAPPNPTPPPQSMSRPPASVHGGSPPAQFLRDPEPAQYSPYGRAAGGHTSAMPALKPTTYGGSPGGPHAGNGGPRTSAGIDSGNERDYYRQSPYQGHQASGSSASQDSSRYPPASHGGPSPYTASSSAYPSPYGPPSAVNRPPHATSPPPQYSMPSQPPPRSHEQERRDWYGPGHQASSVGSWKQPQPPTASQPHPSQAAPQHSWAGQQHPPSKPGTPGPSWSSGPPPPSQAAPPHMSLRDDRGAPMYGSPQQQQQLPPPPQQQQHAMQHSRYGGPPGSRPPDPGPPPPAQAYARYASTPGPGSTGPRDPRDLPPRSYTPSSYDMRGPPPPPQQQPQAPPSAAYPPPSARDLQLRESMDPRDGRGPPPHDPRDPRDPRNVMGGGGGLRPHEYDRGHDQYRR